MRRACKVTLKFLTASKRGAIQALLSRYRSAVNFYVRSLWKDRGSLDAATLDRLRQTELSARYKSQALKQALEVVIGTRKAAKAIGKMVSCPVFCGSATLDAKFVSIEDGRGSFDLIVRLSGLVKGQRITIPTRHTAITRKWLARGQFVQGCSLSEDRLTLWVDVPDEEPRATGVKIGVDVGMNKLLSDSDGNHYGREFKVIRDKLVRRQPGSKGRQRASRERENYINRTINLLPWFCMMLIGVEALHDMKRGKSKKRGKTFRKAVAPWLYRRVLTRIENKAEENRVLLVRVDPANTSRTCPQCGRCDPLNRRGEDFCCVACGHTADADTVGATNILGRTTATIGSVESPMLKRSMT